MHELRFMITQAFLTPSKIGTTQAWTKRGRITGQDEARKRLRARMHKVSDFRLTS
ncbi:hypothetical protein HanIR_Chr11g0516931 [Helianthus annuus]|nr:hypothetical protein HanIR_Chr11g0516931 [Helianthus annuus]